MSINTVKLALEALENASPSAWASRVDSDTMKSIWRKHLEALEGLQKLLAELDNAACKSVQKRLAAQPPAQATQAEVTDEQINAVALEQWGPHTGGPLAAHRAFARAILALRPERVPMSMGKAVMYGTHLYAGIMKGEVREVKNSVLIEFSSRQDWGAFLRWHDGITAQDKKEDV